MQQLVDTFTHALIDAALGATVHQDYKPVSLEQLVTKIPAILRSQSNDQITQMHRAWGNLQIPFALSFPAEKRSPIQQLSSHRIDKAELVEVLGLVVLAIALVAESK